MERVEAMERLQALKATFERNQGTSSVRRHLKKAQCAICRAKQSQVVGRWFTETLGGLEIFDNYYPSCNSCLRLLADQDPWEHPLTRRRPCLLRVRTAALQSGALNHMVPPRARRTLDETLGHLEARWQNARVSFGLVVAERVYLTPLQRNPGRSLDTALLTIKNGGGVVESDTVISSPLQGWPDLAWALIEKHCVLFDSEPKPSKDFRGQWGILMPTVPDIRRARVPDRVLLPRYAARRASMARAEADA